MWEIGGVQPFNHMMKEFMFCVCSGMMACCVAGEAEVPVPVRSELEAELRAGYLPLLMEGRYHDEGMQGVFLAIIRLNGVPVQELRLPLAVRCRGVKDGDEVCGLVYGRRVSKEVLQAEDAENFLSRFAYEAGVSAEQWKDALFRYYAGQRLLELQRLGALMDLMAGSGMKDELARSFQLTWIRYLSLMDVATTVSMQDFRQYRAVHAELAERLRFWEDMFLERYEVLQRDPLWRRIEAGKVHLE